MTTEPATAAQPLCALHRELPSIGTCARCGRFACASCFRPARGLCAECEQRTADPLGVLAGSFSAGPVLASAWKLFRTAPWMALGIAVAQVPLNTAMTLLSVSAFGARSTGLWAQVPALGVGYAKGVLVDTFLRGVLLAKMAGAARGEPVSVLASIGRSARAWPRMAWAALVATVLILLGTMACILPGLYATVTLSLMLPVAYLEPESPAAETSAELTQGHRWTLLALLLLARVPMMILALVRVAMVQVLYRMDSSVEQRMPIMSASGMATALLSELGEAFVIAVVLVAYLRLRARTDALVAGEPASLTA